MRVLPAELGPQVISTAERRVHAALLTAALDGVALHSLNLPEHEYKRSCELDFVVILDTAVVVLEVKGAQVSCRDGMWTFWDRAGHRRTSDEGPFRQAGSGMYALKARLSERLNEGWLSDVTFGWLVVTPDVDLPASAEWAEETYLGRARFTRTDGLEKAIRSAAAFWCTRDGNRSRIAPKHRDKLLQVLRPDFEVVPPLGARAEELDTLFERLTEEQLLRLDVIADNERVLCTGGAGTGKTFLAVEVARRAARRERRTGFVCRGDVLASFVAQRLPRDIPVLTLESAASYDGAPLDYLVVDEAQDLMTMEYLDVLDGLLADGLEAGRWTFFYDPNQQSHLYDCFDPAAEELLRSFGAARATLSRNCRNTREIAFQTRAHTGADIGVAIAGSGPEVRFVAVEDAQQEAALLDSYLRELRAEDVPDGSVTILSARADWETTAAISTRSFRKGRVTPLTPQVARDWPVKAITWCAVEEFKGLENAFICLVDLDDLSTERALDLLYVAMTRARSGLWVAVQPAVKAQLSELFAAHADEAISVLVEARR